VRASIELAQQRGELVDGRQAYRSGGTGRTRSEAISFYSAVQDLEEARRQAEQERAIRQLAVQAGLLDLSEAEPSERAVKVAAEVAVRSRPFVATVQIRDLSGQTARDELRAAAVAVIAADPRLD
jgi:hypothetical protein